MLPPVIKVLCRTHVLLLLLIFSNSGVAQLSIQAKTDGWKEFQAGNYKAAHSIWQPAASQGDGDAALGMAILYENGLGTPKDIKRSVHWYQIAADSGLPEAQHDLGIKYFSGSGVKQDNNKAFNLWKAAAESGLGSAQAKLAYLYTQGVGTKRNYKEAVRWYRQAIKQNNGEAMYNMSLLYQNGTGVRQEKHQFQHWLRQAAVYDHPRAQYDLGLMLMHGMDIEKSVSEGKKWLLKSANNGLVDAQYYLGTLYLNGHILAPDREKAMILLSAADRQGHQGARQTLLDLKLAENIAGGIKLGNQPTPDTGRKPAKASSVAASNNKTPVTTTHKPLLLPGKLARQPQSKRRNDKTWWLSQQSADSFTIQLVASQNENAAKKYSASLPARLNAFTFSFRHDNKRWYAVASGIYATYDRAAAALKKFPLKIRKSRPWIRNVGQLQEFIDKS